MGWKPCLHMPGLAMPRFPYLRCRALWSTQASGVLSGKLKFGAFKGNVPEPLHSQHNVQHPACREDPAQASCTVGDPFTRQACEGAKEHTGAGAPENDGVSIRSPLTTALANSSNIILQEASYMAQQFVPQCDQERSTRAKPKALLHLTS